MSQCRNGHRQPTAIRHLAVRALVAVALIAGATVVGAPPATAAGGITVTPDTGLVDGQTVTVTGSGWVPGTELMFLECNPENELGCIVLVETATADAGGNFNASLTIFRRLGGLGVDHDCADPANVCSLAAADVGDIPSMVHHPISFAPAPPLIMVGGAQVPEGDSATTDLVVPVRLSFASSSTVSAHWATNTAPGAPFGQADPATDFTPASGDVTFPPGNTSQSLTISVNGDRLVEPSESIVLTFTLATNGVMGPISFPLIQTDDEAIVWPGFAVVAEGSSGTTDLVVPLTLSNPNPQTVTVQWRTGTVPASSPLADPTTDFTAASGVVTFDPLDTEETVTISVTGDTLAEANEWVVISFHHPTNARMGGYFGLGFGGITNDD